MKLITLLTWYTFNVSQMLVLAVSMFACGIGMYCLQLYPQIYILSPAVIIFNRYCIHTLSC